MIIALVGGPAADPTGQARLRRQLASLPDRAAARLRAVAPAAPAELVRSLAWLAWEAHENGEGLAVLTDDLVVSDTPLRNVLDDPRPVARALVGLDPHPQRAVQMAGGRVTAAASDHHRLAATGLGFLGLLSVPAAAAAEASTAWASAAHTVARHRWADIDPVQAALVALVRADVPVSAVPVAPYAGARSADLLPEVEALDEDDLGWRQASRGGDGVWSTFVLRPISRRLSRQAVRARITPNQITAFSLVLGLVAAALVASGDPLTIVLGALLLQVSLVVDCVDGEVARSTRSFTPFGAWADLASDRVKEYAALAAIAVATTGTDLWPLALLGLALQLTRHMADYAFADTLLPSWRAPVVDERPFAATEPPPTAAARGDAVDRSGGGPRGRGLGHWVRQAIHLQIGERWLVLSLGLIVGVVTGVGPDVALVAYVVLVALGLAWVLTGWTLRTLTHVRRVQPLPTEIATTIARLRDDGLLSPTPSGPRSPRSWVLPAAVTAFEGAVLLLATWWTTTGPGPLAAAYGWLFVVAWHRYDIFYRGRAGRTPLPVWVARLAGGWAARSLVVVAAGLAGGLAWVLPIGIGWLFLAVVPESLYRAYRSAHPVTGTYADAAPLTLLARLGLATKVLRRGVAVPFTRLLMRLLPARRYALVAGLPDTEENALATAVGLATHYRGEVVLVVADPAAARRHLDHVATVLGVSAARVEIIGKAARGTYLRFVRAELVAYTHGLYDSPRPLGRRLHVNLWHGTGPKWNANANFTQRIGAQAHAASSPLWGREAIRALAMDPGTRVVAGNPREDVSDAAAAGNRTALTRLGLDPDQALVVWLPTFRRSARAGLVGLNEGEDLSSEAYQPDLAVIADAARRAGVQLVAKPHRLDADSYAELGIPVFGTEDLITAGLSVYELLGLAHGVISDYSSVWVDRLGSSTSIALYVPDLASYERARGLNKPDLSVVAADLVLDRGNAREFFAAVASGAPWRPQALDHAAARI
ncbi:MAG: CDP-glycerol glycerophosphotransferase family protein, partial [Propionibacteriaceae bacterium]